MKTIILGILILCSSLAHASMGSEHLTATIIGSGSPVYYEDRASASVLISKGDTHILVDMGNGTQANLNKLGVNASAFSALLFTHHHLDHNEEFVPIMVRSLLGRHDFTIIGPPNTVKLTESNLELYAEDIAYRLGRRGITLADRKSALTVRDIKGGESFDIGNIHVTTIEVPHTIHTVAYRFDYNGESIVITGDLTYSEALPKLAKNADFMIIDSGGMIMKGGRRGRRVMKGARRNRNVQSGRRRSSRKRAHLNLHESSLLAKRANARNLVYTHFTPGEVDQEASLKEICKNYSGNVIFGEDLMVLSNAVKDTKSVPASAALSYPIVDTAQEKFYGNFGEISPPAQGDAFYGQDANFTGNKPSYTDNGNGTITDNVTGLMWQKGFQVLSYEEAVKFAATSTLGGYDDWRMPTIKEMYSLILFNGVDASNPDMFSVPPGAKPFIDTNYFDFQYGANGIRVIDSQYLTSTIYKGRTMRGNKTVFGVNMADGRIKGYPLVDPRSRTAKKFSVRLVRSNPLYGVNRFVDNKDGTVSDLATGLMWTKDDSKQAMKWKEALAWMQKMNKKNYLGYNDWKLPNAKELHSILDYSRSPQSTNSAAIDPVFNISTIKDEKGRDNYPFFWTSTTHLNANRRNSSAVYICFGEALGFMKLPRSAKAQLMDVHGAGAQRGDPKTGEAADYPAGRGPQGDVVRIAHYVRLVREIK